MSSSSWRSAAFGMALMASLFSPQAMAHNDPREMGAGPALPEAAHQAAPADAGTKSEIQDHDAQGPKPMAADGAVTEPSTGTGMTKMEHDAAGGMEGMDHASDNSNKSFGERLFIWLGKLHTVVIHFPIAMIVAAFGLEALGVLQRRHTWRSAARSMLVVGAIGAVVAASLGWFAGGFYLTDRNPVLTIHRYLGMTIAIGSVALAWAGLRRFHHEKGNDMAFAVLLGVLTLGVLVQAFLGGTFMHGGMQHMNF